MPKPSTIDVSAGDLADHIADKRLLLLLELRLVGAPEIKLDVRPAEGSQEEFARPTEESGFALRRDARDPRVGQR